MSDDGVSRRGFLQGMVSAAVGAGACALTGGCGFVLADVGPIAVRHPSWKETSADGEPVSMRVASYNLQHWEGMDGRRDPTRIIEVLSAIDPDIIALQESDLSRDMDPERLNLSIVAEALGHQVVELPAHDEDPPYRYHRNSMMSRFPVVAARTLDLTVHGYSKRGLVDVEFDVDGQTVRALGTHYGLDAAERAEQITRTLNWLYAYPKHRGAVIMGDFNEWFGESSNFKVLEHYLGPSRGPSTYPADSPVFHLDRIWSQPKDAIRRVRVPRNALTEVASDHLCIWADVVL